MSGSENWSESDDSELLDHTESESGSSTDKSSRGLYTKHRRQMMQMFHGGPKPNQSKKTKSQSEREERVKSQVRPVESLELAMEECGDPKAKQLCQMVRKIRGYPERNERATESGTDGLDHTESESGSSTDTSSRGLYTKHRRQMMHMFQGGGPKIKSQSEREKLKSEVCPVESLELALEEGGDPEAKQLCQMVRKIRGYPERNEHATQSETEDSRNQRISDWITHGRLSLFAGSATAIYGDDYNDVSSLFSHSQGRSVGDGRQSQSTDNRKVSQREQNGKEDTDVSSLDSTQKFSNDEVVVRRMIHAKNKDRRRKQRPKSRRILTAKRAAAGQPAGDQKENQWGVRERSSLTKRAGLVFPARESERHLKAQGYRVAVRASVYLSAVLEYLCEEMLLLGAENTRQNKRKRMQTNHIQRAVKHDTEFQAMLHRLFMQNSKFS